MKDHGVKTFRHDGSLEKSKPAKGKRHIPVADPATLRASAIRRAEELTANFNTCALVGNKAGCDEAVAKLRAHFIQHPGLQDHWPS